MSPDLLYGLVLLAAAAHAIWNALIKRSADAVMMMAAIRLVGLVFGLSVLPFVPWPTGSTWILLALACVATFAYYGLLIQSYQIGDLSVVYPIARGSAPVVVLVFGAIALKESVSVGAAVGVLAIAAGVLLVGLGAFRFHMDSESAQPPRDVWFGLAIGAVIAAYTLVDSEAVERADPIAYLALVIAPCAALYPAVTRTRPDLSPRTALTAAATFGAFLMVLAAFRLAPAAPVAAVRETSVVIAAILAAAVLHESVGPRRMAGAAIVAAGVAAMVLA
jgi:drug/metabolite transporter (DMT)-like permease